MAARSWEQFDADLAAGRPSNRMERYEIVTRDCDGTKSLEQAAAANPGARVTRYSPGVAWKCTFLGGKPDVPARGRVIEVLQAGASDMREAA